MNFCYDIVEVKVNISEYSATGAFAHVSFAMFTVIVLSIMGYITGLEAVKLVSPVNMYASVRFHLAQVNRS